jgi:hypothetical protein
MSDYCVKISVKSDNHALHNLSSNPTDKVSEFDNKHICILRFWVFENSEQHSWHFNGLFCFRFFNGVVTTVRISTGPKSIELSGSSTFWMILELDPSRLLISSIEVSLVLSSSMNGKPASPCDRWAISSFYICSCISDNGMFSQNCDSVDVF